MGSRSMVRAIAALALCCLASGAVLALAHGSSNRGPADAGAAPVRPSRADRYFMEAAARSNLAQVEAGLLAEQRGTASRVKAFGARMVTDVSRANNRLIELAEVLGVRLPTRPTTAARERLARLERLRGSAFDAAYIRGAVEESERDVHAFGFEEKHGRNPRVIDYAESIEPVVDDHLLLAKRLR